MSGGGARAQGVNNSDFGINVRAALEESIGSGNYEALTNLALDGGGDEPRKLTAEDASTNDKDGGRRGTRRGVSHDFYTNAERIMTWQINIHMVTASCSRNTTVPDKRLSRGRQEDSI